MNSCDCYILRGDIYLLDYSKSHEGYGDCYGDNYGGGTSETYAGVKVGNAVIQMNIQQTDLIKVSRTGLEFTGCAYPDLTGSTVDINLLCTSMKNLAMAFRGLNASTASIAGPVVDEIYTAPCDTGFEAGSFVRFVNPADVTTVVLETTDIVPVLLIEGTDYTLTELGFTMLVGLAPGIDITADYTSVVKSIDSIQAFTQQPKTFKITVVGENVSSDDDESYIFTFKKVRLSAMTNPFDVLNEDFPELTLTGSILKDQLAELNKSPFLTVEKIS